MTREEAKEIMLKLLSEITKDFDVLEDEEKEAFNKAIEALEEEPCDDVVSIEAVIEWLKAKDIIKIFSQEEMARKELKVLPSVRPQEPTGHWIIDKGSLDALYGEVCICSECGVDSIGESDFCPYCGCRMVEPQERSGEE